MRFFAALMIAGVFSQGEAAACPLNDMLKLCVMNGDSVAALHRGVERGDWTVEAISDSPASEPRTGSEQYTMPSGLPFHVFYADFKGLFSAVCELNFPLALGTKGKEGLSCSNAQSAAFETALTEASLGTVTKESRESGTAYLIEGPAKWMKVVVASGSGPQDALNAWVETSVLKKQ
ncbi:hypothetical protein [Rhizobium sp. CF142]|uniref:hypothetical protein n=1 Tax=Rhizobium sp. CF142 TaxID=1144314 RepID=UPI00026EEF42|nr:hypothetical protein [Rhizobium sp. CF142]EJJ28428.1 hypothetical protein PMI11_03337 [Rhizobium sp. CF142]